MTFWGIVSGTFLMLLVRYGADQAVLQRYASTRTLREARDMFLINIGSVLVV
ncbi:hypothetical protein [Parendozoicomonas sp. Alg238-R29]|uniref:hypothetical protein n=1 Tax=Parendozoicomonas sp. Alg238-R29 TaxID=2993446 RepID=UPI00248F1421|nr:hypothetical protein [Parendozoicomonas sp. Alg238-R29]